MRYLRIALELVGAISLLIFAFLIWGSRNADVVVLPPFFLTHDFEEGTFTAHGTWRFEDDQMAWPTQATRIECFRKSSECLEVSAVVAKDMMMPITIKRFDLVKWNRDELILEGEAALCTVDTYHVSFRTNQVTGFVAKRGNAPPSACAEFQVNPKRMRMIDGYRESMAARYGNRK